MERNLPNIVLAQKFTYSQKISASQYFKLAQMFIILKKNNYFIAKCYSQKQHLTNELCFYWVGYNLKIIESYKTYFIPSPCTENIIFHQ